LQSKTTGVEEMEKILNFLENIEDSILIEEFHKLNLTGNEVADKLLIEVSHMMLQHLKSNQLIHIDDLKIYGLSEKGIELYNIFKELAYK